MMPPPPPPSHVMGGPSPMPLAPFPRPPAPPALNMPPVRPMLPGGAPPTFSFNQNRPPTCLAPSPATTYEHTKVVYAAPPMINKPVTEAQKTESLGTVVTTVTAAAKPSEKTTTVTEAAATVSTVSMAPHSVASGIELNIPVEKIEAEKKSTITVSQPPSTTAAPVEIREPSTTQSNTKKDKKEKKRKFVRMAAGTVWEDQTLGEWDLGESFLLDESLVLG